MVASGAVPVLVNLLCVAELAVVTPTLRAIGNIVTGSDEQTESVLKAGVLPNLAQMLKHTRMNLVKEAAWTVSNITAGSTHQIQQVIDAGIIPLLVEVLAKVRQLNEFKRFECFMRSWKNFRATSSRKRRLPGP